MEQYKDMTVSATDVRAGDLIDMDEVFGLLDDYGWGWEISDNDRYASQFEYATIEEVILDLDNAVIIHNDLRNVTIDGDAQVIIRRPITPEG